MKSLKDYIVDQKCRKGKADGTTKNGAYWLAGDPVKIRRAGGDGIGQSAPDITFYLRLRHFRDGAVRPQINKEAFHQNGVYSGGGDWYFGADQLNACVTIEDVIIALKAINVGDSDYAERVYDDCCEGILTDALAALGMPLSVPAPDEQ